MRLVIVLSAVTLIFVASCGGKESKLTCESDQECHEGYACDTLLTQVCLRACSNEDDCLAVQYCDIAAGDSAGVCRDGTSSGGDPGGSD
jgi:hypothetical protein